MLAALVHPVFMAALVYTVLAKPPMQAVGAMGRAAPVLFVATLLCGYVSTIALDVVGLRRRGLLVHAWVVGLTPVYWFLLSLAAWRALFQLLSKPQYWEKTEHGLARTSRARAKTRLRRDMRTGASPLRIIATGGGPLSKRNRGD